MAASRSLRLKKAGGALHATYTTNEGQTKGTKAWPGMDETSALRAARRASMLTRQARHSAILLPIYRASLIGMLPVVSPGQARSCGCPYQSVAALLGADTLHALVASISASSCASLESNSPSRAIFPSCVFSSKIPWACFAFSSSICLSAF